MNCLEFRRQKLAMPKQLGTEEQQHLHECPQCAAFSERIDEHEDELRKTVLVTVPEGLADRVLLNLLPHRKRNFRILAFAASLLLSASLVLVYQHMIHRGLADAVIAHVLEEPNTLTATQKVAWENLAKAEVITEGARDAKCVLYVFFDSNCFYCHLTWKALQPYEKVGLQVRWVPVAYQKPSSVGRAAAIMEAPDRAAALRENEVNYDTPHFDGGVKPVDNTQATLVAQLQANTELMRKFGVPATPLLVWKDSNGNVRIKPGVPPLSQLPGITGLPEQKVDDPELANFR